MLLVKLLVNGKLLVKFWGIKSYKWIFSCMGSWLPNSHVLQGSTVLPFCIDDANDASPLY